MLINTVILFIKDIFPIFVLFSFLTVVIPNREVRRKDIGYYVGFTLIAVYLIYTQIENISETFDGDGVEILNCLVNAMVYICLLLISPLLTHQSRLKITVKYFLIVSLTLFTATNLSEFFIYFTAMLSNNQTPVSTLIGSFFGFGICLSFSALFAILLNSSHVIANYLKLSLWLFYLAGFATQNIRLLQQIDVISSNGILWNTSEYIADASEYGYLLNTIVGYIATPTIEYGITYVSSLVITLLIIVLSTRNREHLFMRSFLRNKK